MENLKITRELLPTPQSEKSWGLWNYFALWVGMNIAVATYIIAESYLQLGLSAAQVVLAIVLGCLILVLPMSANGHAGAKYGIASPIYWRSACGVKGASAVGIIRAAVAVFYFGFHLYIGAKCVNAAVGVMFPAWKAFDYSLAISFAFYWALTLWVLTYGAPMLKKLESYTAPFLILWMAVLLYWGYKNAGGWGTMLFAPPELTGAAMNKQMLLCITAVIGWWATLVLNITDFTRYAKNQKAHIIGSGLGNPLSFGGLAAVGAAVTSCTVVMYGSAVWDPIELTTRVDSIVFVVGMLLFLGLAEITTNTAANAFAPCMDVSHVSGGRLSFKQAVMVFGVVAIITQPWKIMDNPSLYVNAFLVASGAFLAPLAGVNISNYIFIKKTKLNVAALYDPEGEYAFKRLSKYNKIFGSVILAFGAILLVCGLVLGKDYLSATSMVGLPMRFAYIAMAIFCGIFGFLLLKFKTGGFNPVAIFTIVVSVLCTFIGVYVPGLDILYNGAWFVATIVSIIMYYFLMKALDPEFSKIEEVTELNMDNITVV